jgi:hypothetical protein
MGLNKPNKHCNFLTSLANNLACVLREGYHGWLEVCIWPISEAAAALIGVRLRGIPDEIYSR